MSKNKIFIFKHESQPKYGEYEYIGDYNALQKKLKDNDFCIGDIIYTIEQYGIAETKTQIKKRA